LRNVSTFNQVYSERAIRKICDSLGISRSIRGLPNEITEEELLALVNDKFSSDPLSEARDSIKRSFPSTLGREQQSVQSSLSDLTPVTGKVVKSKYLQKIDSVRDVNLEAQGVKLKEHTVSKFGRQVDLNEELAFLDKSYFEGIIGISNTEDFFVQLSPAIGYHFLKDLSLGVGPVVNLYENDRKRMATVGIRPFLKREIFKQRAYLQAEYVMNPSVDGAEALGVNKHNALIGGGVLFSVSKSLALNFCAMHRFENNVGEFGNMSSWTFRIGISSIKSKK